MDSCSGIMEVMDNLETTSTGEILTATDFNDVEGNAMRFDGSGDQVITVTSNGDLDAT